MPNIKAKAKLIAKDIINLSNVPNNDNQVFDSFNNEKKRIKVSIGVGNNAFDDNEEIIYHKINTNIIPAPIIR